MDLADYANTSAPSSKLSNLAALLAPEVTHPPIDIYRRSVKQILTYGTKQVLDQDPFLGRLLVLGLVSAAEGYIRSVLSACLELCPIARAAASKKQIGLGGLLWHGRVGYSRSAFEHFSFTGRDEVAKTFREYAGITLDDAQFRSVLEQYDIVCQLRHGIVHADGFLPGKNAVLLDIPSYSSPVRIYVRYAELQEVAAAIDALVVSINRYLFTDMCRRWAVDWRRRADWNSALETRSFKRIWSTFHSADEQKYRRGRSKITRAKCLADVKLAFGI